MGRKARQALCGLAALGARLKQLRNQSGLSQMKLARLIGFDPAHGYKYILRLEKGQVPNPTFRTVAACIEACGAKWQDIVDVLPRTGTITAPAARPSTAARKTAASSDGPPFAESPVAGPRPPAASPRRKDSRPMREQLRSQRFEQRELHNRRFWSGVKQADEATAALLHTLRVPPGLHRGYLAFTRACCSAIDAFGSSRPEVAERELTRLIPPAVAQGLDRRTLTLIQSACTRVFGPPANAG